MGSQKCGPEINYALTALVIEVIRQVNDQVERRTYGLDHLHWTIKVWETLFQQQRIALLLSHRCFRENSGFISPTLSLGASSSRQGCTVRELHSGDISIFKLLATDTLSFTMVADQAVEHEERCFAQNIKAWGPAAEAHWKDIVKFIEYDDFEVQTGNASRATESSTSPVGRISRKKPLLQLFPDHNQRVALGAYRALILCAAYVPTVIVHYPLICSRRWHQKPHQVKLFSFAVGHLYPLPPVTRAAVSTYICYQYLFPVLRSYLRLEERVGGQFCGVESPLYEPTKEVPHYACFALI